MSHIVSKLKALKLKLFEDLLVYLVLILLPAQFSQFKVSYNCQKEKWTLNKLISYCLQEEERLKHEKSESTHLVNTAKDKGKKRKKDEAAKGVDQKKLKESEGYFFCKKPRHIKKECTTYHAWHAKKGMFFTLVCSEVNLTSVPRNTLWLDCDTTTHISVSMQGCLSYRRLSDGERYIFVGNEKSVEAEAIGHFRLLLGTGLYLDLKDTFVIPSFRQNLVFVSVLDKFGYHCSFETIGLVFH